MRYVYSTHNRTKVDASVKPIINHLLHANHPSDVGSEIVAEVKVYLARGYHA